MVSVDAVLGAEDQVVVPEAWVGSADLAADFGLR
jgi:hypothetical protein